MAAETVKISDVITPSVFTPYTQELTEEKSRIVQSGALVRSQFIDGLLAGGGLTFNVPSWKDLANDADNVSSDDDSAISLAFKTSATAEIAVRLSRNNSWSWMRLTATIAGADPAQSIANRVADYWTRRLQVAFVATVQGVFADNAAAPSGSEHVQNDLTVDVSGAVYAAGVTDFNADSFIDACTTLGDSQDTVSMCMMHSVVYARAQKNNLIDFVPDSQGQINIPTFLGRRVVVDDGMPNPAGSGAAATASGVYHTWLFGPGAAMLGVGTPQVPTEIFRTPSSGNGAGQDTLWNRVEWCIHPVGHKYVGTPATKGGPTNATSANNLAHADSWVRVFPERKQIKIARLITRES